MVAKDPHTPQVRQAEASAGSSKDGGSGEQKTTGSGEKKTVESGEKKGRQSGEKKKKCQVCRKKLGLTGTPCRCGPLFCAAHIHDHGCTYDYKAEAVAELRRNNPVISPPKVTKF